ncbi:glycoprotein hormone beta-5 [Corythoichthys intestinalis]|uniref:glycoprotein hormone beta-5 n=1 Tax=Corythoichthys intestinalis TaxID=161448 RepID=UPI0025A4DAEF|nr:glycoprotein hormone beta-5 [Corythoichthys intestinalis]XP_061810903.1 glycoprotein hormone beta-5-like [Nerophis lumbriciformis]
MLPPTRIPTVLFLPLLMLGSQSAAEMRVSGMTPALHGFRGCAVRDFSFVAQKPGCKGLRVTTEACWGRCHTWERPVLDPPFIHRHHCVCTYALTRYASVRLPGCQPDVSPLYHYPVALHCHCAVCNTLDSECESF